MSVSFAFLKSGTSRYAIFGAALAFMTAGSAVAQDQPTDQPGASAVAPEEIVVTGSRIRTSDVTAADPLTVVTAEQISKTDAVTVEQFLRKIPSISFAGGISSNDNNGGLGASEVSLKNLGAERTLVLVNGFRFPYTDTEGSTAAVDFNNIPTSMIDHIEILRDGASSIYGADAIAGVINVITKQNFNGFQVDGSIGETSYGDGTQYSTSATLGQDFANGRGNIIINLSYDHHDAIPASDRSWAVDQHPEDPTDGYDNISSRMAGLDLTFPNGNKYFFPSGVNSGILATNAYTLGHPIDSVAFGGGKLPPGDVAIPGAGVFFNYLPTEYLTGSDDRKSANFSGHYDITDNITAVIEGFFTNRESQELLNPEPLGQNVFTPKFPNGMTIPYEYQKVAGGPYIVNPYFPTAYYTKIEGAAPTPFVLGGAAGTNLPAFTRRFENGPRIYSDDVDTYRFRFALQGTVFDDYNWETGYYYGQSTATYRVANEVNFEHLEQLAGDLPCGPDKVQGCSIANFAGYNTLTKAQAQYLIFDNTDTSGYGESTAYGNFTGPVPFLPELPGGPVKFATGFEYRTENGFENPDSVVDQGDAVISSGPTSGGYSVGSGYIEVKAPVFKDLPWVKSLDLDVSSRYDYYSSFGRALTYKAGVDYAINDDFRLRGSNSTGFRAPQIKELYGAISQSAPGGSDPCATGGAFVDTPACVAVNHGKPGNLTQVNQLSTLIGGNSALKPETSQSWNIGGVFTPTFIPNFSLAIDYYTILIRSEIGSYDPNALLSSCYGGVAYVLSQTASCALISRQAGGNLGFIKTLNGNIADENTDGIDIDAAYGFDAEQVGIPGGGHIQLNGSASYLLSDNLISQGVTTQYAGTFNNTTTGDNGNGGEPRWKATVSAAYSQDNWSFQWTTEYYGGLKNADQTTFCLYGTVACPKVGAGDFPGNETAGIFYHDIAVTYAYDNINVTLGVDNLFDKDPPYLVSGGDVYISDAGYNAVGRMVYMKSTIKFGAETAAPKEAAPYVPPPAAVVAPSVPHSYLVFFDFNKSDLTPQAVSIVNQAASNAGPAHVTQLTVTGHTDTVGSDAYNMRLSRRRAESVAAQLEKDGIASSEIEIVAKGKRDLLVPTADGVKEPQNRRVQIVYSGGPTS
jgi:iron complex outermembrane recepter protein